MVMAHVMDHRRVYNELKDWYATNYSKVKVNLNFFWNWKVNLNWFNSSQELQKVTTFLNHCQQSETNGSRTTWTMIISYKCEKSYSYLTSHHTHIIAKPITRQTYITINYTTIRAGWHKKVPWRHEWSQPVIMVPVPLSVRLWSSS